MAEPRIRTERVHDVLDDDGSGKQEYRVLVDRLWPRGIAKDRLGYDEWDKDVTPSEDLRKTYHHGELSFDEFRDRYSAELDASSAPSDLLDRVRDAGARTLTLLFANKDTEHNHAEVLREHLEGLQQG